MALPDTNSTCDRAQCTGCLLSLPAPPRYRPLIFYAFCEAAAAVKHITLLAAGFTGHSHGPYTYYTRGLPSEREATCGCVHAACFWACLCARDVAALRQMLCRRSSMPAHAWRSPLLHTGGAPVACATPPACTRSCFCTESELDCYPTSLFCYARQRWAGPCSQSSFGT